MTERRHITGKRPGTLGPFKRVSSGGRLSLLFWSFNLIIVLGLAAFALR